MKYIFLALLITQISVAQYGIQYQDPKTPELYQFERYGNQPVSKYTGTPNVSIPLYNIKTGDIDINLALSYTSNGIRVDEEASQFGLGWYFGTGMISQTRQGKDDLYIFSNWANNFQYTNVLLPPFYHSNYGSQYITQKQPEWYWSGLWLSPPRFREPDEAGRAIFSPTLLTTPNNNLNQYFAAKISGDSNLLALTTESVLIPRYGTYKDYQYAINWRTHWEDASIDIFQANFFGHKISFYIKPQPLYLWPGPNPDRHPEIEVINNEKYKVELTRATLTEYANVWCITAPDGIKYYFEEENKTYFNNNIENHAMLSIGTNSTDYKTHVDIPTAESSFNSDSNNTYRTWKITRIVDTKANSVLFNYYRIADMVFQSGKSGGACFYNTDYSGHESYTEFSMPNDFIIKNNSHIATYALPLGKGIAYSDSFGIPTIQERSVLQEIHFGTARLVFNNSERVDNTGDKKVDNVQIFSRLPLTEENGTLIKQIDFSYDYFSNSSSNEDTQKRLRLNSILFDDKPYVFTYNPTELPLKDSVSSDFWGYYNGMPNTTHISNPLRLTNNTAVAGGLFTNDLLPVIEGKANRSAHPDFCKAGILEKIQYPTGGSTEFVYELNEFNNYFAPDFNNKVGLTSTAPYAFTSNYIQTSSRGFGLRVKETIDRAADDGKFLKKKYEYSEGKHIPVFYCTDGQEFFKVSELRDAPNASPYNLTSQGSRIVTYNSSSYQSSFLGNGNFVGYGKVSESEESESGELNGMIVSTYTNVPDKSPIEVFQAGGSEASTGYRMSNYALFGQSIRNSDFDNGLLLKEEVYDNTSIDPIKTTEYNYNVLLLPTVTKYNVNAVKLPETHGRYCPNMQNEPFVISEYIFFYYPLRMPRSILKEKKVTERFNSRNIISSTENLYDLNFIHTGQRLKDRNNNIFYEENKIMNSSIYYTDYRNIFNLPENKTIKKNGVIETLSKFHYLSSSMGGTILTQVEIHPKGDSTSSLIKTNNYKYDSSNNLQEFKDENQISTSVIYGYGNELPIAKIQNISYSQLGSIINIQDLQTISTSQPEANLLLALNALRSNPALSNKMITTYTHKHLIGISTVTDPNGVTQYYDYDAFNKLKSVKDKDGNILSENEYHFKP